MTYPVTLYLYDLSQGMAKSIGPALGISDLEGIWHTAIVVHDMEFFFGGSGVEHCPPGATMLGQPLKKISLGKTSVELGALTTHLRTIGQTDYHGSRYDLLQHNCNNFSASLAKYLGVQDIPQHILDLPAKVMSSPFAAMLRPIIEQATPDGQGQSFAAGDSSQPSSSVSPKHFPPAEFSIINPSFDLDKVMSKLIEFNSKHGGISDEELTHLRLLNEQGVRVEASTLDILSRVLDKWPREETFPILNLLCCNIAREGLSKSSALKAYNLFKTHSLLSSGSDSAATRMSLRILVNCFSKEESRIVMLQEREQIIGDINTLIESIDGEISPQVENAVASLALNYAKAIYDQGGDSEAAFQLVSGLASVYLAKLKGPDALFKVVAAIATLSMKDSDVKALTEALEVKSELARIPKGRMQKLDDCVRDCLEILKQ